MSNDEIRSHIHAAAREHSPEGRRLAARMLRVGWPAGPDDHAAPAALSWIRRWRPARAAAAVPACSCASGHCAVCN